MVPKWRQNWCFFWKRFKSEKMTPTRGLEANFAKIWSEKGRPKIFFSGTWAFSGPSWGAGNHQKCVFFVSFFQSAFFHPFGSHFGRPRPLKIVLPCRRQHYFHKIAFSKNAILSESCYFLHGSTIFKGRGLPKWEPKGWKNAPWKKNMKNKHFWRFWAPQRGPKKA